MTDSDSKVVLKVGPSWTSIEGGDGHCLHVVDSACSARDPRAYFTHAYQRGYSDGHFRLLDRVTSRFPTGLLYGVCEALEADKIEYEVDASGIEFLTPSLAIPDGMQLRDYQEEAAGVAIEWGRGILGMVVNSGKSYVAAALIKSYNLPAVVLSARVEGQKQMYELLAESFGEDEVATEVYQGNIVVLTYSTATKRDLSPYKLLIADECHRVGADTYYAASMSSDAYHRFGLSGTPGNREDGKDIYFYGATGPVIYKMQQATLVERGYSAQAKIFMVDTDAAAMDGYPSWNEIEEEGIVHCDVRNQAVCEIACLAAESGKQALIMVRRIAHGHTLRRDLLEKGIEAPFTHGSLSTTDRTSIYESFKSGDTRVLIASGIYDDSVDVPGIEVLVNASGGKSLIQTKQKLGRGLRNPGGKELIVVDFYDGHNRILAKHSNRRRKVYEKEGFEVDVVSLSGVNIA